MLWKSLVSVRQPYSLNTCESAVCFVLDTGESRMSIISPCPQRVHTQREEPGSWCRKSLGQYLGGSVKWLKTVLTKTEGWPQRTWELVSCEHCGVKEVWMPSWGSWIQIQWSGTTVFLNLLWWQGEAGVLWTTVTWLNREKLVKLP